MNKFIRYDIENGLTLVKCGVRNALYDLDTGEITEFKVDEGISINLIRLCMKECGWKSDTFSMLYFNSPSGKRFIYNVDVIKLI